MTVAASYAFKRLISRFQANAACVHSLFVHVCVCACMHVCMCVLCVYVCVHVSRSCVQDAGLLSVCVCIHFLCVCVCVHVCVYVCMRV
jgi:hypothetical protein